MTSKGGNWTDAVPSRDRSMTAFAASLSSTEQVSRSANGSPTRTELARVRHQQVTGSTSTFSGLGCARTAGTWPPQREPS